MQSACKIAIAAHLKAFEYPLTNVEPVILAKIVIFGWPLAFVIREEMRSFPV